MAFNENTRVKIPAILHLIRLGYEYISLDSAVWDIHTNIFTDIFKASIAKINPDAESGNVKKILKVKEATEYIYKFYNLSIAAEPVLGYGN